MCPSQVDTPEKAINKYIHCCPDSFMNLMEAACPATIEETFRLAARVNSNHVMRRNATKTSLKTAHQATVEPTVEPSSSTKKNKGYKKAATINSSKGKATVKKLKSRKKYYFKVRCSKTVKGHTYYSAYSKIKSIKIK